MNSKTFTTPVRDLDSLRVEGGSLDLRIISVPGLKEATCELHAPDTTSATASRPGGAWNHEWRIELTGAGPGGAINTGGANISTGGNVHGSTVSVSSGDVVVSVRSVTMTGPAGGAAQPPFAILRIPEGVDVKATTGTGDIRVTGPLGSVSATTGSGDVSVSGGYKTRVFTDSGRVRVEEASMSVLVVAGSGGVSVVANANGPISASTTSGDILIDTNGHNPGINAETTTGCKAVI